MKTVNTFSTYCTRTYILNTTRSTGGVDYTPETISNVSRKGRANVEESNPSINQNRSGQCYLIN